MEEIRDYEITEYVDENGLRTVSYHCTKNMSDRCT